MGRAKKKKTTKVPGAAVASASASSAAKPNGTTKVFVSLWAGASSAGERLEEPEISTGNHVFGEMVAIAVDARNGDAAILETSVGEPVSETDISSATKFCRILRITKEGEFSIIAGGVQGFADGRGESASFHFSGIYGDVAFDAKGNLIVCDSCNIAIRYVTQDGTVTTIGGDCPFRRPTGLAIDTQGNIFVVDESNHCVYKFQINSGQFHNFRTLAGCEEGYKDGFGKAAMFLRPFGICIDGEANPNIFINDRGNNLIRKISSEGLVSTVMRVPSRVDSPHSKDSPQFPFHVLSPIRIAVDGCGSLVVSFADTCRILKYTKAHEMSVLQDYRTDSRLDQQGLYCNSGGMAIDRHGNLLVCHLRRIQKVKAGLTPLRRTKKSVGCRVSVLESRTSTVFETLRPKFGTSFPMAVSADLLGYSGSIVLVASTDSTGKGRSSHLSYLQVISPQGFLAPLAHRGPLMYATDEGNTTCEVKEIKNSTFDIAFSDDGSVYIVGMQGHSVLKFSQKSAVCNVAGNNLLPGYQDGSGESALFNEPSGVALDELGNLIIADTANHCVRQIVQSGSGHVVSTLAGNGSPGHRNGLGTQAQFTRPKAVAVDSGGNVHVYDMGNSLIRTISPAGVVSSFALDMLSYVPMLANLGGLAVDGDDNLIVSDLESASVIKITRVGSTSFCSTVTNASELLQAYGEGFHRPKLRGLAVNRKGEVLVCDHANHRVLVVDAKLTAPKSICHQKAISFGYPTTFSGNKEDQLTLALPATLLDSQGNTHYLRISIGEDGIKRCQVCRIANSGCATNAVHTSLAGDVAGFEDGLGSKAAFNFNQHSHIVMDLRGNLIVSDSGNHAIRKVTPKGMVFTIAGRGGVPGYKDGLSRLALFDEPSGVAVDADGRILVADTCNHCIRLIQRGKASRLLTVSTVAGVSSSGWKDGFGNTAQFSYPLGICVDERGDLFVADSMNHRIRKVHFGKDARNEEVKVSTLEAERSVVAKRTGHDLHVHVPGPARLALSGCADVIVSTLNGTLLKLVPYRENLLSVSARSFKVEYISSYENTRIGTGPRSWHGPVIDGKGGVHMNISGETEYVFEQFATVSPPQLPARHDVSATLGQISQIDYMFEMLKIFHRENQIHHLYPMSIISDCVGNTYVAVEYRLVHLPASFSCVVKIPCEGEADMFAGGKSGFKDAHGLQAQFDFRSGACMRVTDLSLIVADVANHSIRKVDTDSGIVSTLAGCGQSGYKDGPTRNARFNNPVSIALDSHGNVFVSDCGNRAIRLIIKRIGVYGEVATLARDETAKSKLGSMTMYADNDIFFVDKCMYGGVVLRLKLSEHPWREGQVLEFSKLAVYAGKFTKGCVPKVLAIDGDAELIAVSQDGKLLQVRANELFPMSPESVPMDTSGTFALCKAVTDLTIDRDGNALRCGLVNGAQKTILDLMPPLHFADHRDVKANSIPKDTEDHVSDSESLKNCENYQELKSLFAEDVSLLRASVLRHKDTFSKCASQRVTDMHPRLFQELWTQECQLPLKLQQVEHVNQLMTKQYCSVSNKQFHSLARNLGGYNITSLWQWFEDREQKLMQFMQMRQATSHQDDVSLESGSRPNQTGFSPPETHPASQTEISGAPEFSLQSSAPLALQTSDQQAGVRSTPDASRSESCDERKRNVVKMNGNDSAAEFSGAGTETEETILTLLPGIQAVNSPRKVAAQNKPNRGKLESVDEMKTCGKSRIGFEGDSTSLVGDDYDRLALENALEEAAEMLKKSQETVRSLQADASKRESEMESFSQRMETRLQEAWDKVKRERESKEGVRLEAAKAKKRAQEELVGLKEKLTRFGLDLDLQQKEFQRQIDLKERAMQAERIDLTERAMRAEAEGVAQVQKLESRLADTLQSNRRLLGNKEDLVKLTLLEIRALAQDVDKSSLQIRNCLFEKELEAARSEDAAAKSALEASMCCVCIENARDTVLNCGHLVLCNVCSVALSDCPICRVKITKRKKIFM